MTSLETFEKFETISDEFNDKQVDFNSRSYKLFEQYLNEVFEENKDLNIVFIFGYHRSFEDGEPTFHRQRTALNKDEAEDNGFVYPYETIENFNTAVDCLVLTEINNKLGKFKEILKDKYDTNWLLIAKLDDAGKLEITTEDYYCE